jgi:hypothetical protein
MLQCRAAGDAAGLAFVNCGRADTCNWMMGLVCLPNAGTGDGGPGSTNHPGIPILCAVFALVPCTSVRANSVLVSATETDGSRGAPTLPPHPSPPQVTGSSDRFLLIPDTS